MGDRGGEQTHGRTGTPAIAATAVAAVAAIAGGAWLAGRTTRLAPPPTTRHVALADAPLRTGDILLARNPVSLASRLPRILGDCPFTHVAVVFVEPATGHRYAWDICGDNPSRASARPGARSAASDVFLHRIDDFVFTRYHHGTVYVRYLEAVHGGPAAGAASARVLDTRFRDFMCEHWDDHEFLGMDAYPALQRRFLPGLPVGLPPPPARARGSALMCCDLARLTLEAIGVARPREDGAPMLATIDFCSPAVGVSLLEMRDGYRYGPEVQLTSEAG